MTEVTVSYNLIDGDSSIYGENAVEESPVFIDVAKADFHLRIDSPAINNGTETNAPLKDYENKPRPIDNIWDIGAYEFR
jgi:hypothetical protein